MQNHLSVLTAEAVKSLALRRDTVVVDCTLGAGGHAKAILEKLGSDGVYVGIDADESAIAAAEALKSHEAEVHLVCGNFRNLKSILSGLGLKPTAILADLGWRTDQFETGNKGFSFQADEPLLMTYGDAAGYEFIAKEIVNEWEEENIADIIYGYGEERFSRLIAKAIVEAREERPIKTAAELANVVVNALPARYRHSRLHPATKTFQALRIAVNDELGALKDLLADGFDILSPSGRLSIISFHSLEDRIVKKTFQKIEHDGHAARVTKKPITASAEELKANPRARSAKLRTIEKND